MECLLIYLDNIKNLTLINMGLEKDPNSNKFNALIEKNLDL
jgi:hypothetical protein